MARSGARLQVGLGCDRGAACAPRCRGATRPHPPDGALPVSRSPRKFYEALAIGAPAPLREPPVRVERMIHFVPPHIEKIRAKVSEIAREVDVVLGNLEDAIPADAKEAARAGFIAMAKTADLGAASLWTRINCLNSPWALDDVTEIVREAGDRLDVMMLPKVEGPWDIHYLDQLLAQLEARHGVRKPILIHAILETAEGVKNVEAIAAASPRMHGMSLGPADLAASRAMKTTRVGGGHPDYKVLADAAKGQEADPARPAYQQDLWHYTVAKMVDACQSAGIKAFYGPFGDFSDPAACEAQFRNAFLMGCAGAWSLHPSQIAIAKKVFSPDPGEVAFARRILAAMPDGSGAVMIDGKMQDDATWKQAKVIVDLARQVAARDADYAKLYDL
ncbi:MAG: CoA ester lyase [Methylobacteriaceae bacterium]|nr:CoA ester lyase [Methylobacteriaceae bacterium]